MMRGGLTEAEVIARMLDIVRILRRSVAQGIAGTRYGDRVLGHQSGKFNDLMNGWEPLGPAGFYDTFGPELSFGKTLQGKVPGNIAIAKSMDLHEKDPLHPPGVAPAP